MRKFYEFDTHGLCEEIIQAVQSGQDPVLSRDELIAIAIKMLWLELDYAYIRTLGLSKIRADENASRNYRTKNLDKDFERLSKAAGIK